MPDPNIDAAFDEIRKIVNRRDLSGVIFLGSKTHTQFDMMLPASWNGFIVREHEDGTATLGVRIRSKDCTSEEEARTLMAHTIGQLIGLLDTIRQPVDVLTKLTETLAPNYLVSHTSTEEKTLTHGVNCPKVAHQPEVGGYLHDEEDDSTYDVDGIPYCGRCHKPLL